MNETGGNRWIPGVRSGHYWKDGKHEGQTVQFQVKRMLTLNPAKAQLTITNLE